MDENTHDDIQDEFIEIIVRESLDEGLGSYVWPSAYALIWYLIHHPSGRHQLATANCFLELGSGVGLVGIALSRLCRKVTILTDHEEFSHLLRNLEESIQLNHLDTNKVYVKPLTWGMFHSPIAEFLRSRIEHPRLVILGADVFYSKSLYEPLIGTIAWILEQIPTATFVSIYQERSARQSITSLLKRWGLVGKQIPLPNLDLHDLLAESFSISTLGPEGVWSDPQPIVSSEAVASMFLFEITLAPV